ncbi:hypothetical protein J2X31_001326 [Flavobacterium arsenatis]|uniref:Uncharacterized protein n=1 Tax=Flavobacterium arsenatis TaxID=1484332 RepID=A0ABU1TMY0_9FLAO|nr:DUF6620 family protein [Flavobacterium arsenatis]MDR6967319.1 hypothetical protein [Flavobacterium arsenatis]
MSNPLLEPIHGVSLQDYSTITAKIASGLDVKEICKALGIEPAIFEEASAIWVTRMQEDSTWEVTTLFGKYFGEADQHPKLSGLQAEVSEEGKANLENMRTDRYFYEELNGARQSAYEYGIDGAQWIQDNFGINLGDFQSVAMQWMPSESVDDYETIKHYLDYREQKQKEYAVKFAEEQGGNVADDVEF